MSGFPWAARRGCGALARTALDLDSAAPGKVPMPFAPSAILAVTGSCVADGAASPRAIIHASTAAPMRPAR
jgi:hypothetical protein